MILAYYNSEFNLEKIKIVEEISETNRKISVIYNNSGDCIEFIYFSDGTINVCNNYCFNNSLMGQDYSLTNLLYNPSNPNVMIQKGTNSLSCPYEFISYFSEDGIEDRRKFKLFPQSDMEENHTRTMLVTIQREDNFVSAKINCDIIGDDFNEMFPSLKIEQLKNIKEQIIPLTSLGILKKDLNMLNVFLNSSGKYAIRINKDIREFVISLLCFEEIYDYETEIAEGRKLIENAPVLDTSNAVETIFQKSRVHSVYSDVIFDSVKSRCKNKLR